MKIDTALATGCSEYIVDAIQARRSLSLDPATAESIEIFSMHGGVYFMLERVDVEMLSRRRTGPLSVGARNLRKQRCAPLAFTGRVPGDTWLREATIRYCESVVRRKFAEANNVTNNSCRR